MGMFDYVKYNAQCRKCGEELDEWQSKDGPCMLATIQPERVERFYTNCPECEAWNEYKVIPQSIELVLEEDLPDYKKTN